jgi:D-cysteine desulfhydrase
MTRALFELWPDLARKLPSVALGDFPTPVQALDPVLRELGVSTREVFVKRDDLSSELYGGNKVRPLELLLGRVQQQGGTVYATGAYGSNQVLATLLHARRLELPAGVVLFPQPRTPSACAALKVIVSLHPDLVTVPHWSALPAGMALAKARSLARGARSFMTPPGGATPRGVLAYVSAGLELALQIQRQLLPEPRRIYVPTGSNATSAGLLAGLALAARLGIGFRAGAPELNAVRIGPWPITSRSRVLSLSTRTLMLLARLTRKPELLLETRSLGSGLRMRGEFLGGGYGHETVQANEACVVFARAGFELLDETYSGKAAAALIADLRAGIKGPLLFWSTKSSAPLPPVTEPLEMPAALASWLENP